MNQILEFGNENSGKAPKWNKNKGNNGGGGSSSDKIIKVFAFLLMIIAIALIASGVFSLMKNKKDEASVKSGPVSKVEATVNAEKDEETGKVIIDVLSEIPINKLIYNWDKGTEKVISGDNNLTMNETVDLPSGTHTLTVKVIDNENNETIKSFSFESESGVDTTPPEITMEIVPGNEIISGKHLLITAIDDTEIGFITYMWNEGEQETVNAEEENQKEIKVELEIPRGKNTINVIAVDASEASNTKSATKTLDGVTKPDFNYSLSSDSSVLTMVATHEEGIKNIFYTFDGQNYEANFEGEEIQPKVEFTQNSIEGYNEIYVKITSVDDTVYEFKGNWEYTPSGENQ